MHISLLSIFPDIFQSFLDTSLIAKAQEKNLLRFSRLNIRDFAEPPHLQVDDTPYGGGAGMVMKVEPIVRAVEQAKTELPKAKVLLLSASGPRFSQATAKRLSQEPALIFICGRYEGVDQRVSDLVVDEEISLGDYVLMGGEVAAMVVIEAVCRLIPGVIKNAESLQQESFAAGRGESLEYPHYTRPLEFRSLPVPPVLTSGNHQEIERWRSEKSAALTAKHRPPK